MALIKNIYLFAACFLIFSNCKQAPQAITVLQYEKIAGETMGTTYHITCEIPYEKNLKHHIDSILVSINDAVSTYESHSIISSINRSSSPGINNLTSDTVNQAITFKPISNLHFINNIKISQQVYNETEGYFDPTVMPLVNYWGFGYTTKKPVTKVDKQEISNILMYIGLDQWQFNFVDNKLIIKKPIMSEIDFSAVAKGYAVDVLANYLNDLNSKNYLIEIGGEVYAKGVNQKSIPWTIGLNTPKVDAAFNNFEAFVQIDQKGLASSGNYQNYYEVNGIKYGHEINPKTGFPEKNKLLGVSVIAENCASADAYATAFMVMGLEKAQILVENLKEVDAIFFYGDNEGGIAKSYSTKFEQYLRKD